MESCHGEIPIKAALLNQPSAFLPVVMSTAAVAIVFAYAVMFGVAPRQAKGSPPAVLNTDDRTGSYHCLLRYQVASDPAEAGGTRSCLATRRGSGRDFPGLVVSLVTLAISPFHSLTPAEGF